MTAGRPLWLLSTLLPAYHSFAIIGAPKQSATEHPSFERTDAIHVILKAASDWQMWGIANRTAQAKRLRRGTVAL